MSQTAVCTVIVIDSDAQGNADYHLKLKLSVVISFVVSLLSASLRDVYGTSLREGAYW